MRRSICRFEAVTVFYVTQKVSARAALDGSGYEKTGQSQRSVCDIELDHILLL
ncbi:hypothetical protein Ga0123462_1830 [Mariprofundus ferrinatatus]|uniref:Uncharacterized protein n=1 Tax=Mariprofundus ferrinatatus TaxID=1921087 RepID=A0A2K8L5S4_9PROT|nr:hypothetical protein Ga0123462_1830 [Mariprofundus ferrinatatus]